MTSYFVQSLCGPVISPYISDNKGDFVNKTKCAGEQMKNNLITSGQTLLAGGLTVAYAKAVTKQPKAVVFVEKALNKLINKFAPAYKKNITLVGESGKLFHTFEITHGKLADKLLKMPGKTKVLGAIALAGTALIAYITGKGIYKMGQIDQKYTDRAKIA